MPEETERWDENVGGPWFVDENCNDCPESHCVRIAPENFAHSDVTRPHKYVFKQPDTHEEKDSCQDARDACPSNAIGAEDKRPIPDPGPWYVDEATCRNEGNCRDNAREIFALSSFGRPHSYVARQPSTIDEVNLCRIAKGDCPSHAIHDDGV